MMSCKMPQWRYGRFAQDRARSITRSKERIGVRICTPTHPVNVPRHVVRVVARLVERVRKAENGHD